MPALKQLHFIAPYVPYPANFGGAIDVFHRIVTLKELGVRIHLHCFEYDRSQAKELERYCEKVYYYKRDMRWKNLFSKTPFIVKSRENKILTQRLKENPFPILYDGLHCTATIPNPDVKQKKFIRTHNVESNYYLQLAKKESNVLRKGFYYFEFLKILLYEKNISSVDAVFPISKNDYNYFSDYLKSYFIRAFHSNNEIQSKIGCGSYALYHGNLTVPENINAVHFLLNEICPNVDFELIIAGKITSRKLAQKIKRYTNVELVENPNNQEMGTLIQNAQQILLPTFQNTGIKLKLLESLFRGRFCIVNGKMIDETELEAFSIRANTPKEWIRAINHYRDIDFSHEEIEKRKKIKTIFDNLKEAQKMIDVMFTA
jgi:hypothetical protein